MDSQTKRKIKGRLVTLISKLDELKMLGYENSEINDLLPSSFEGFEQELIDIAYTQLG